MEEVDVGRPPARAIEVVTGILAALAIEETTRGGIERFYEGHRAIVLILCLLMVGTAVRFLQGNTLWLEFRYRDWDTLAGHRNAWLTVSSAHVLDVVFMVLEYSALLAAGLFLARDATFRASAGSVAIMLGIDALWAGLSLLMMSEESGSKRNFWVWLLMNGTLGAVLGIALLRTDPSTTEGTEIVQAALVVVLLAGFLIDYSINHRFYSERSESPDAVNAEAAASVLRMVTGLIPLPRAVQLPPCRDELARTLHVLFWHFMENADPNERARERSLLFNRPADAQLHVGIYIRRDDDAMLVPIFRYADYGIGFEHRGFRIGQGYIGVAYSSGSEDPAYFVCHPRPDPALDLVDNSPAPSGRRSGRRRKKDDRRKHYRSSVITNVFLPKRGSGPKERNSAIGTVVLTSDREDYFTEFVHAPMLLALSRFIGELLDVMFAGKTEGEVRSELLSMCSSPVAIKVEKKRKKSKEKDVKNGS